MATYRAIARRMIDDDDGSLGRASGPGDWRGVGEYDSLDDARRALSTYRARGWQTRIMEAADRQTQAHRTVEQTGMNPGDHDAGDDYDAPV